MGYQWRSSLTEVHSLIHKFGETCSKYSGHEYDWQPPNIHKQTDSQKETIRTFTQLMRAYTNTQREQWECFLPMFEFAMNNAYNASTGMSPVHEM